ncbi:MAG: thioredoxin family protein [Planctomycetota bacterium]|nr:MAG: thioredoxin family protein [Planctomycetota bacterium]
MRLGIGCFCLLVIFGNVSAGEFNSALNVGDPAPVWSDLPGADGKTHSLADLKDTKVVVVVFTCNSCPVAAEYEDRIIAFAKNHAEDVAVVAINVNRIEEDNLEHMKERAESKKFPYLYLFDESQKIAKDFGATYTPEFYVLGPDRKIVYMGGMDDNSDPAIVTENYLEPAVESILKGTPLKTKETRAIGCRVRYARARK